MVIGIDVSPDVGKATQIKPGQALPGAGRPSKKVYEELMSMNLQDTHFDAALKKKLIAQYGNVPVRKAMSMQMLEQFFKESAAKGKVTVHKEVVDREEGKAVQAVEISGGLKNDANPDPEVLARHLALLLTQGAQKPEESK